MSWTSKKQQKQAEKLFDRGIAAAGGGATAAADYFPRRPDATAQSYFVPRKSSRMEPTDFEVPGCSAEGELKTALYGIWSDAQELVGMTAEMATLSEALRTEEQQTDEVSPFIYVMF